MTKEMMKDLHMLHDEAYKEGVLGFFENSIQLNNKAFRATFEQCFEQCKVKKHNEEYDCLYVIEDGLEFFTLVRF